MVSAVTGALDAVLGKLGDLLAQEYRLCEGEPDDIRSLTDELTFMHAFLLKMSEEEDPDAQDKVWMNAVRELSYDIEDSLDDFMQEQDTDGIMKKMLKGLMNTLGLGGKRKRDHQIFQNLKIRAAQLGEMSGRYKTRQVISNTKNATVDPRALVISEHASKLIGIDKPKAELIKLLTEEDGCASTQQQPEPRNRTRQQQPPPKVVSIVGSGGMGKTTLAYQVYQDLKGRFQCGAFVSVSRNPDMKKIMRTILSEVSGQEYRDTEAGSIQQLIRKISDFLADKRYFIVIDDIWKNETWNVIKCAFPMTRCGIIVTTTRMKDVANSCRSSFRGHIYNIRPLDMEHSRQLFYKRLFDSEGNCPSYLQQVSEQILEKCAGLPLAIIAIAGLLHNTQTTEHRWSEVKDSIGRTLERNASVELMMKILSLSYFDLPLDLKTCLLYLSIFPEDSIIEKKVLIRRWTAEGCIHKEGRYTLYELGERCFNELINRSLIQPVDTNDYGKVKSCRVHDIVLDFIITKSIEENFVTLVPDPNLTVRTQSKVRRLSLQGDEQGKLIIPTGLVLSHVRSLNVFGDSVEIPCLDEFSHLRVLDFGGHHQLEDHHLLHIERLFLLRYLNLSDTSVCNLPEQIGLLGCLEMLNLEDTHVGELPASIVDLGKLRHLLVDKAVKFPDGIAKMQALEILKCVGVFWQTSNFLQELGLLKNLMKLALDFENRFHIVVREEDIASSIQKLGHQNLRCLTISNGNSFLQQGDLCSLPPTLHKLEILGENVPQVTEWMGSFSNLQQLLLNVEEFGQEGLRILGGLPALLILQLIGAKRPSKHRLTVSGELGFRCLRQFHYVHRMMYPKFVAGAMQSLETIGIYVDADNSEWNRRGYDFKMENLPRLTTIRCDVLIDTYINERVVKAVKAAMEKAASTHPNRPTLLFQRI